MSHGSASTSHPLPGRPEATARLPRLLALAACAGLLAALFCPWLSETAITRGLGGSLRLRQTMTGWQALSASAAIALVVAVAVVALLASGAGRGVARRRLEGTLLAAGGAVTAVALVWTLAAHEDSRTVGPARLHDGIGWGVALALACGLALVLTGAWTLTAARHANVTQRGSGPRAPAGDPAAELGLVPVWERGLADDGDGWAAPEPAAGGVRTDATRTRRARSPRR